MCLVIVFLFKVAMFCYFVADSHHTHVKKGNPASPARIIIQSRALHSCKPCINILEQLSLSGIATMLGDCRKTDTGLVLFVLQTCSLSLPK